MTDYHIHTLFSCDSHLDPDAVCLHAMELGFSEIAFTEHLDFDPLDEGYGHYDYEAISRSIHTLRERYGDRLLIRKGVEITYQRRREGEIATFLDNKDYDLVLGSVHLVGSFDISQDKGTKEFFSQRTREEAFRAYLRTNLQLITSGLFDCIGHLEMIRRYSLQYSHDYAYGEFKGEIDEILRKLIMHGVALEINTSGFRHLPKESYPRREVIERYLKLGGELLTVGSDSHLPEHIGYRVPETVRELKEMGVRYLTTFDRRRKGAKHV